MRMVIDGGLDTNVEALIPAALPMRTPISIHSDYRVGISVGLLLYLLGSL